MKVAVLTHAGGAHLSAYFSALAECKDCDEVVLADPDDHSADEARKLLGGKLTRTYTEYAKLLANESPKLCMVSAEDSAIAALHFSNGMLGTLNSGYYLDAGYHTQIRIWGSKGWLNLDSTGTPKMTWYENTGPSAKQIQTSEDPTAPSGYSPFVAQVVAAIAHSTAPPITTQESLNAIRTVFGIYTAAETGRLVETGAVPVPV